MRTLFRAILLCLLPVAAHADTTLVNYSFDGRLPTAEDGFYLFENARGFVEPSDAVKFSGYRSLELQEAPLDDNFVELQGIVPPLGSGDVLFHFAFYVKNPAEELNIAVAGPAHFYMKQDGIIFWLKTMDGVLFHHTDSMPKRLFKLEPDSWHVVDVVFHLAEGTYDMRVLRSGTTEPLALLKNQRNAINTKGSRLSKISFIGDLEDRSSVHYFVDDVELRTLSSPLDLSANAGTSVSKGTNGAATQTPAGGDGDRNFIEKGEPSTPVKNYFDEYLELKQLEYSNAECLPATAMRDFGIERGSLRDNETLRTEVKAALRMKNADLKNTPSFTTNEARGIYFWRRGCLFLAGGDQVTAGQSLAESLKLLPGASLVRAAAVISASARRDRIEAETQLIQLYSDWADDARLPVLLGKMSAAWANYEEMRDALSGVASRLGDEQAKHLIGKLLSGDDRGFDELKLSFGKNWRDELDHLYIGQSYYHALLFTSRFSEAQTFAQKMMDRYDSAPVAARYWKERAADAFVLGGKQSEALPLYKEILSECATCESAKRKMEMIQ